MSEKKRIYKPSPISGFPEWLPEVRMVEQAWMDHIRGVFERYGFCNIETPSVEALAVISAKGEDVDKEIYVLERLQAEEESKKDSRLALHFDQTVPLARYVAQHFGNLVFPFKRYQMQKVWRGERPQMGRMREFYQCDIDVIHVDNLPLHFDAEVAAVMYEVVAGLPDVDLGRVQLRISNRKILGGLLENVGLDTVEVFRLIDKKDKMPPDEFQKQLSEIYDSHNNPDKFQVFDTVRAFLGSNENWKKEPLQKQIDRFRKESERPEVPQTTREGLIELVDVLTNLLHLPEGAVVADLSIVRGLDYYTGTVYETQLLDVPEFTGSVCSGGRYDDLAGSYINKHLPGVGISLGFSRLFDVMRQNGRLKIGAKCPADILMVMPSEETRGLAAETAQILRKRGYNVEQYHAPQKISKQMVYAEKKGIPYVWFPPFEKGGEHQVKDMVGNEKISADPATWGKG